jgi:hypothetical protein
VKDSSADDFEKQMSKIERDRDREHSNAKTEIYRVFQKELYKFESV